MKCFACGKEGLTYNLLCRGCEWVRTKDYQWLNKDTDVDSVRRKVMHEKGQKCMICDGEISANYYLPMGRCFTCYFWNDVYNEMKENTEGHTFAVAKNVYASNDTGKVEDTWVFYSFREGHFTGSHLGSGGRKFVFTYLEDGRSVESNSVWCRGDIPERYMPLFEHLKARIKVEGGS